MDTSAKPTKYTVQIALFLVQTQIFMSLLNSGILIYRPDIVDKEHRIQGTNLSDLYAEYDFIIIGAGSARSVVANRLSEIAEWKILLIEAGGEEPLLADIPMLSSTFQRTSVDWQFETEPSNTTFLDLVNRTSYWPRGKLLGGTSEINGMVYTRGNKKDYDQWEAFGNIGWGYDQVLPYFKKSEDMRIPELKNSPFHGVGGYLSIEQFRYLSPISDAFLQSGLELGYGTVDINGESQAGFTKSQCTLKNGLRCGTAKCFLRPIGGRENLHISLNSYVVGIVINESTKIAEGVQFQIVQNNVTVTVAIKAKKEVILSAGTVKSPQLLMLSGIGSHNHLLQKGIQPIVHLPGVGQNLQDHVSIGGITFLFNSPPSTKPIGAGFVPPRMYTLKTLHEFLIQRKGPLYDQPLNEVTAFVNTKLNPDPSWPDIQLRISSTGMNSNPPTSTNLGNGQLTTEAYDKVFVPILFEDSYSIAPVLIRPKSVGHLELKDKDPNSKPLIFANYLDDKRDLEVLIEGANIVYNFSKTETMRKYNSRFNNVSLPGCENYTLLSDEFWECEARHFTQSFFHAVGTCKMGISNDTLAVVSPELLVYGVPNLRVIDASVMPKIVSGNTNAATIMVAEKASDMIKYKWMVK